MTTVTQGTNPPLLKRLRSSVYWRLQGCLDDLHERFRSHSSPPVLWIHDAYGMKEVTCSLDLRSILAASDIVESKSEADRQLDAGAIQMRPWNLDGYWRKVPRDYLPEPGDAIMLRRGKRMEGIKTVMLPTPSQTFRFWRDWLSEKRT